MPARLSTRPELDSHLVLVWEGFWLLSRSRVHGDMGSLSGILFSECVAYVTWLGLDREMQDRFLHLLAALDGAYLTYCRAQQQKAQKK